MDLQSTHDFIAHGEISRGDISVPVTIVGKYSHHRLGNIGCKIVFEGREKISALGYPFDGQNPLELKGKTEEGKEIWIPEFRATKLVEGFFIRLQQKTHIH